MTKVHSVKFDKMLFDTAPASQRVLYLMASQLWNDVLILTRQMLVCQSASNKDATDPEKMARLAAQILNLRLLASRLHEGQSFYTRLKSVLPGWKSELSEKAVSAIKELNTYFAGNKSALTMLRNKIGFHTDFATFEKSLELYQDPSIEEFMGDTFVNTLFMSGESANLAALASIVQTENIQEALNKLIGDSVRAMDWTYAACQGYHRWFLKTYVFPHIAIDKQESLVDLSDAPQFKDLKFQFFAHFDGMLQPKAPA